MTGVLKTNAGQWALLKHRAGTLQEEIGRVIMQSSSLGSVMTRVSDAIKAFTDSGKINEWATKATAAFKTVYAILKTTAGIIREIIDSRFEIMWIAIAVAAGQAAVKVAMFGTALMKGTRWFLILGRIHGLWVMIAGAATLAGAAIASAAVAGVVGMVALGKSIWEAHRATIELIKSRRDLDAMEEGTKAKFGTRNASTLRTIRETMQSGTPEEKAKIEKMYPKAVAEWRKGASPATPDIMPKIGNAGPTVGGISADTSMLSTGDLFSMMQAGTGYKRDSELSELQGINQGIQDLIEVSGGVK
jgi:hypothetical protein